jgi:hypothetical protein
LRAETAAAHEKCAFVGVAGRIMGTTSAADKADLDRCVATATASARQAYMATPQPSTQAGAAAVKAYFAAWLAAMEAIPARAYYRQDAFKVRADADQQRLAELWATFDLESKQ